MKFLVAILSAALVFASGCSLTNSTLKLVTLTTDPVDCKVIANGVEYYNVSPQFIEVAPDRQMVISVYKPGYREGLYVVDYHLSSTGKIDAWSSILIFPMFGLLSKGAWELKENNIHIKLEPLPPKEKAEAEALAASNASFDAQKAIEEAKAKAAAENAKAAEPAAAPAESK